MDETRQFSRLRYVDADDLDTSTIDLDDLEIRNDAGDTIGEAEGFIVDAHTGRPYYLAVNSGGWFSGGRYLLPVGYTRLGRDDDGEPVLLAHLDKEAIKRFPAFDRDHFASLSGADLRGYERNVIDACNGSGARAVRANAAWDYEGWDDYRQPGWWHAPASGSTVVSGRPTWAADRDDRHLVTPAAPPEREWTRGHERPEGTLPGSDRAQPGDVIGIENAGATTSLGDTPESEAERLEDQQDAARRQRE